jgi:hypothetical protein
MYTQDQKRTGRNFETLKGQVGLFLCRVGLSGAIVLGQAWFDKRQVHKVLILWFGVLGESTSLGMGKTGFIFIE